MDGLVDFWKWARVHRRFAITIAMAVLWIYAMLAPIVAPDLPQFLYPWFNHIRESGPVAAFSAPFSNYNPPYLYLLAAGASVTGDALIVIKALAIIGVVAVSLAIGRLLRSSPIRFEAMILVFLVPTVVINAAFYGQCDEYWVAACLLAVASAIEQRHASMLIWSGLAFAFKAQAAFLAPFVFVILLQRRVSPLLWPLSIIAYVTALLPAWLAGWPALDLATIYMRQADHFNTIGTAPGPWAVVAVFSPVRPMPAFVVGYLGGAVAVAAYVVHFVRRQMTPADQIRAALLSAMIVPFLLPKMHERFTLLADLLAFALAFMSPSRETRRLAILVIGASTIANIGAISTGLVFDIIIAMSAPIEALAIVLALAPFTGRLQSTPDSRQRANQHS